MNDRRLFRCRMMVGGFALALIAAAPLGRAEEAAERDVAPAAEPFPLDRVRLLDGPFRRAEQRDREYLLSLDPDRLLHNFRVTAGIPSSAKPLGGWEAPDCELRGHSLGHYLSACAMMYASTGDATLRGRAEYVVGELARCQEKLGTGYLSAFPEELIDRVEQGRRVWAPWYTLHKIYAGLLDVHQLCDNPQALEVLQRACEWILRRTDRLDDERMQRMLDNEHGGMNDVLAELAAVTGQRKYLDLARRFNHRAVLDPLSRREDRLTGLHANTQFPKILGAARQHELTGDPWGRTIATFFWDTVVHERSYVTGGNSDGEMFSPKESLSRHVGPASAETCNTYNMLKITRRLFCWEPKAEYADYSERALYNHILASQNPEDGMMCYYLPLKSGSRKTFSTPNDSFWCCVGTGMENHAKYGESIYFHSGEAVLYVNLFIASELRWDAVGLTVRQETDYPEGDRTRLVLRLEQPRELEIRLRRPAWAVGGAELAIGGDAQPIDSRPGEYVPIRRRWADGDRIEWRLPMSLRSEGFRDNPAKRAILYGPLVLCAPIQPGDAPPVVVGRGESIPSAVERLPGETLRFRGSGEVFRRFDRDAPADVELVPFYQEYRRPYVVYWDVLGEEQWAAAREDARRRMAAERALAERTLDQVAIGDEASEREHDVQGERSASGVFAERRWRHATDGGWFSYRLKVSPEEPCELLVTYWGSDAGRREFDILVDGRRVATQKLEHNRPNEFLDETYAIAEELTRGKQAVIVRFQAAPGATAGGVFGLRTVRRDR